MAANFGNGANYSALDAEMLCKRCDHGQVLESSQGGTRVVCRVGEQALVIPFVVTKCSSHTEKQLHRLWDTAQTVLLQDQHAWVQQFVPNRGHVWVRADSAYRPEKILMDDDDDEVVPTPAPRTWRQRWTRKR